MKYYNRQGQNRYAFDNYYISREDTIDHTYARQEQLMLDVGFKPNERHTLDFHFWKINNHREIAPLAFGENINRSERNSINRFGLRHKYYKNRVSIKSSLGYMTDLFRYTDELIPLTSVAQVQNVPLNSSLSYYLNDKSDIGFSYNQQLSFYNQQSLQEDMHQYGGQVFYNNSDVLKGFALNTFLQKQFASIGENPFTYGLKLAKRFGKRYIVYASYNTNYRLPTLNELYYFPGGREDLKPESSKNLELGGKFNCTYETFQIENAISLYSRNVEDWILWTGSAIFFANNIAEVWSRGIENNLSVAYEYKKIRLKNDFLMAYNKATSEKPYFVNDQAVGKQIPYVPRLSWRNNFYVNYQKLSAQVNLAYTGYRFVTRDESVFVNPYTLFNIYLGYKIIDKKSLNAQLQLKLNNLSNENYESVRGRIMPRRNYAISIVLNR